MILIRGWYSHIKTRRRFNPYVTETARRFAVLIFRRPASVRPAQFLGGLTKRSCCFKIDISVGCAADKCGGCLACAAAFRGTSARRARDTVAPREHIRSSYPAPFVKGIYKLLGLDMGWSMKLYQRRHAAASI